MNAETMRRWLRRNELREVNLPSNAGWHITERDLQNFMDARANRPG